MQPIKLMNEIILIITFLSQVVKNSKNKLSNIKHYKGEDIIIMDY